jgi:hypothetical protein
MGMVVNIKVSRVDVQSKIDGFGGESMKWRAERCRETFGAVEAPSNKVERQTNTYCQ